MSNERLDVIACQYRFWGLLSKHAPEVREDLFDRGRKTAWTLKDWDARWARLVLDPDNPRGTGPHPAALEWCDCWKLPDWCLGRAEHALSAAPSRQLKTRQYQDMDRWRKAISGSAYYYLKPPPFEFTVSLWPARTAYKPLIREECRERILTATAKAADEYFDKHVATFKWLDTGEFGEFDKHCRWLILYLLKGLTDPQIAEVELAESGDAVVVAEDTIRKGRKNAANTLSVTLPKRQGRRRKPETKARK